jgi:ankyrin repeat protein
MQACYHGRSDIVDLLMGLEPELNLFEAAALGRLDRARSLVDADPDLVRAWSPDGFTALHFACFFGHPEIVELLLERGAEVDAVARNELGVTPLQSAAAGRHVRAAELLLNAGADVHPAHPTGFTPLHSAAANGDRPTTELLLRRGADPARAKDDGKTPVDLAAENEHEDIVALLRNEKDG